MGFQDYLTGFSLIAVVILASVSINLLSNNDKPPQYIYLDYQDHRTPPLEGEEIIQLNRSDVARIASFNIQVFGPTKMSKSHVIQELVMIFEQYDLVAVQEIKDINQQVPYDFLAALNDQPNIEWGMVLSNRSGLQDDDQSSQEQYAYYYNKAIFIPLGNGTLYDDSSNDSFQREPFLSQFELLKPDGNSTGYNFTLANIHTKPTEAVSEMSALGDVLNWSADYFNEVDQVILGDFNGDCSYASYNELVSLSISTEDFVWLIPDDADTTVGSSRCAYDRIVTTGDIGGRLTGVWGIDESVSSTEVSDHRPVWFEISRL